MVVSGLLGSDSVGSMTQAFDSQHAGARTLSMTGYTVNDGNSGGNYSVTTQTAAGTISQAALTLSAVADSKVYDSTLTSSAAPIVVSGLVGSDSVGSMTQAFDSRHAGSRTLAMTGYTVNDGNSGGNYSVTTQTAAGTISPAALTLSAVTDFKVYDSTVSSSAAPVVVSGLVGSDSVGSMTQAFDSRHAGSRVLVMTGYTLNDGNSGANYSVTTQSVSGGIAAATLTLSAATDAKVYDSTVGSSAAPVVVSGLIGSDSVGSMTQAFDSRHAGSRMLVMTGYAVNDGNGGGNYTVTARPASGLITPATLTLAAVADTKVYDTAIQSAGTPGVVSGLQGADGVASLSQRFDSPDAGPRTLVVSGFTILDGNGGANYSLVLRSAGGTIAPAALSVIADDKISLQGQPTPALTASFRGLVGADTPGVLNGTLALNTSARNDSPAGRYAITAAGLSSINYMITFVDGVLSVGPPAAALTSLAAIGLGQRDAGADFATLTASGLPRGLTSIAFVDDWPRRPFGAVDRRRIAAQAGGMP